MELALIIVAAIYVVGFLLCARGFDYGPTQTGADKFIGALIWPVVVGYALWRVWTKQITATMTLRRKGQVVRTYRFGKKV